MTSIVITPSTHWINGWFLRLFAVPVIRINDVESVGKWNRSATFNVEPSVVTVAVGLRYRRSDTVLGDVATSVPVQEGDVLSLRAKNGFFNHSPFVVSTWPPKEH